MTESEKYKPGLKRRHVVSTGNSTEAAQVLHDVLHVLGQQCGLLVGFEGATHQLGQQLVGGDPGTAGEAQPAADGRSELRRDLRARRQPPVGSGVRLHAYATYRKQTTLPFARRASEASVVSVQHRTES